MAVIDELVARLGFKTTGLGELKRFESAMERAKDRLAAFGTAMHANLGGKVGAVATGFLPKLGNALKSSTIAGGRLGLTLAGIAAGAAGVVGVIGLVAAGALKMATAFLRARGEAAGLRRELQLTAKGQRTTAVNVEKVGRGFAGSGLPEKDAAELVKSYAEKINEAIREKGKAPVGFAKRGVAVMDKDGVQRDTSAVVLDAIREFEKREAAALAARRAFKEKPTAAKRERANKLEREQRETAQEFKFSENLVAALREGVEKSGVGTFERGMERFNRDNPTATKQEEDDASRRAQQWAELANKLEGITKGLVKPFEALGNSIFDNLIGPINSFADAVQALMKRFNLISETAAEKRERETQENAAAAALPLYAQPGPNPSPIDDAKRMLPDRQAATGEFIIGDPRQSTEAAYLAALKHRDAMARKHRSLESQGAVGPGLDLTTKQLQEAENAVAEIATRLKEVRIPEGKVPVPPERPAQPGEDAKGAKPATAAPSAPVPPPRPTGDEARDEKRAAPAAPDAFAAPKAPAAPEAPKAPQAPAAPEAPAAPKAPKAPQAPAAPEAPKAPVAPAVPRAPAAPAAALAPAAAAGPPNWFSGLGDALQGLAGLKPALDAVAAQMSVASTTASVSRTMEQSVEAKLTGTANVEGKATMAVQVTASSELLRVVDGAKSTAVALKGQLEAGRSAIGRSSAKAGVTATAGGASP